MILTSFLTCQLNIYSGIHRLTFLALVFFPVFKTKIEGVTSV